MKPYQKKYRRKEGKKNTRWTDEDKARLRTLYEQGLTYYQIGQLLDRSEGSIAQQIYQMKKRDAAEGYVHVAGGVTELSTSKPSLQRVNAAVTTQEQEPIEPEPKRLTDAMLEDFDLYERVIKSVWDDENPSIWTRIKRWFRK
jgi:uncharacterized protein YciI